MNGWQGPDFGTFAIGGAFAAALLLDYKELASGDKSVRPSLRPTRDGAIAGLTAIF